MQEILSKLKMDGLVDVTTDARDTTALKLGHDMCLCTVWELRSMRWSRQHLFHL